MEKKVVTLWYNLIKINMSVQLFQFALNALSINLDLKTVSLVHLVHDAVFSGKEVTIKELMEIAAKNENEWDRPPIVDVFIAESILPRQSVYPVPEVIQALINGERFDNCGDSVRKNLGEIRWNRPATAQRMIDTAISIFSEDDTIQEQKAALLSLKERLK